MNKAYQKPEVEIVDFAVSDSIMDVNMDYSDGWEWDDEE